MNRLPICVQVKTFVRSYWTVFVLVGVPFVLLPLAVSSLKVYNCTFVICVVSLFWVTEVLNLAVTSMIPLVLFPAFGILTAYEVATCYMKESMVMMIGGLIVAKAIEEQNIHSRLALRILLCMGSNPIFQYFGFMLTTWFLSMWISNTASTAMMVTLANAVIGQWKLITSKTDPNGRDNGVKSKETESLSNGPEDVQFENKKMKKIEVFGKGLYLGIAYAAACGGIATLIGTSPNIILYELMDRRYGSKIGLTFATYMLFALPLSFITAVLSWNILCLRYVGFKKMFSRKRNKNKDKEKMEIIKKQYRLLGPIGYGEISALTVFGTLVLLWILRESSIPLWGRIFIYKDRTGKYVKYWSDGTSAILMSVLVFVIPSKNPFRWSNPKKPIPKLLEWRTIETDFPWGIMFLFGGGYSIAAACSKSGLSEIIGNAMATFSNLPEFLIILLVTLLVSFLTEIASNSATSIVVLPIMITMAECIRMHPMKIALATTIASSFSFCLPAATPPNLIVYSTGRLKIMDMVSSGLYLNVICVFVLTIMCHYYSILIFNTEQFPAWINTNCSRP